MTGVRVLVLLLGALVDVGASQTDAAILHMKSSTPLVLDGFHHQPLYLLSVNGSIFGIGSHANLEPVNHVVDFTPTGLIWRGVPEADFTVIGNEPLVVRFEAASCVVGQAMLLIGGRCLLTPTCPPVISWDGIIWTALPPLPYQLFGAGAAVLGNRVYLVGGTALNATGGIMTNATGVVVSVPAAGGDPWDIQDWVPVAAVTTNGTQAPLPERMRPEILTSYAVAHGLGLIDVHQPASIAGPVLAAYGGAAVINGNETALTDAWAMVHVEFDSKASSACNASGLIAADTPLACSTWRLLTSALPATNTPSAYSKPTGAWEIIDAPDPRVLFVQPLIRPPLPAAVCAAANCSVFPLMVSVMDGLFISHNGMDFAPLDMLSPPSYAPGINFYITLEYPFYGDPFTLRRWPDGRATTRLSMNLQLRRQRRQLRL